MSRLLLAGTAFSLILEQGCGLRLPGFPHYNYSSEISG
ncbi:hypothetical protein PAECIP111893_05212 [Paenibacillus plantiphilus]|uniref:Uncharacterized protein n=1 Tax=Paenibacillus plantiphilus TaxID=2905650 RepID=A0ABN8H6W9_9BACL|nr:hypothetical protein PAECIP111893_05212 [Paenibacillus plantiphilus]